MDKRRLANNGNPHARQAYSLLKLVHPSITREAKRSLTCRRTRTYGAVDYNSPAVGKLSTKKRNISRAVNGERAKSVGPNVT